MTHNDAGCLLCLLCLGLCSCCMEMQQEIERDAKTKKMQKQVDELVAYKVRTEQEAAERRAAERRAAAEVVSAQPRVDVAQAMPPPPYSPREAPPYDSDIQPYYEYERTSAPSAPPAPAPEKLQEKDTKTMS
ncbi:uncharacterized protein LOC117638990 [Thrips palmi]|uniref:Uncharacterized protein LOC117638990 n=1 Tax=Thrips palmi TaxID=161013 RepID=A0A6P8ZGI2_THRPL|nr:uncharacterized protein LOC117638990 [Thrips palmi]